MPGKNPTIVTGSTPATGSICDDAAPAAAFDTDVFRTMRVTLNENHLFQADKGWYAWRILFNIVMFVAVLLTLTNAADAIDICLSAFALAFVTVQFGFIGHDALHGQISRDPTARRWLGLIHWNLLTGLSCSWWQDKHDKHHRNTNVLGEDPDLYPLLSFSHSDSLEKRGLARFIARHQRLCFLPMMASVAAYFRLLSLDFLLRQRPSGYLLELSLLSLHYLGYFGLVFYFLAPLPAVGFIFLNYFSTGLYMGAVFSTNHLAMPLVTDSSQASQPHSQLGSSRNIEAGRIGDFLFGGLNYQIEHHLFPSMPRSHLRAASKHLRLFCAQHSLPYQSCKLGSAYRVIAMALHDAGAPLRPKGKTAC
ncbi:acyl-CoA desaturase [soil metagenome]